MPHVRPTISAAPANRDPRALRVNRAEMAILVLQEAMEDPGPLAEMPSQKNDSRPCPSNAPARPTPDPPDPLANVVQMDNPEMLDHPDRTDDLEDRERLDHLDSPDNLAVPDPRDPLESPETSDPDHDPQRDDLESLDVLDPPDHLDPQATTARMATMALPDHLDSPDSLDNPADLESPVPPGPMAILDWRDRATTAHPPVWLPDIRKTPDTQYCRCCSQCAYIAALVACMAHTQTHSHAIVKTGDRKSVV